MISAETGDGVDDLMADVAAQLPRGARGIFPDDQLTDLPVRLLAAEVTREQLFRQLHEEVPYALTVETEAWEEFKDGSAKVDAGDLRRRATARRPSCSARAAAASRRCARRRRPSCRTMLERKVHLFLFVKVRENWQEDPRALPRDGAGFRKLAIHPPRL